MEPFETTDLWKRFILGDNEALSAIYNRYVHALYSYGLKIYNDPQLIKDCIQEVFIQTIAKKKSLKASEITYLYLFKSLRNKILEEIRTKNRQFTILKSIGYEHIDHDISSEQSRVNLEEDEQRMLKMAKALESLSNHQIEAVFLKYSQGLSYEEIADVLDLDISSARTLIFRSLKRIKENLDVKIKILFFFLHS